MELSFIAINYPLILGCMNKNRQNQRKLYKLLSPFLYTKILEEGYTENEAEEVLQNLFIEILNCLHQYNEEDLFEDWCMQVFKRMKR